MPGSPWQNWEDHILLDCFRMSMQDPVEAVALARERGLIHHQQRTCLERLKDLLACNNDFDDPSVIAIPKDDPLLKALIREHGPK